MHGLFRGFRHGFETQFIELLVDVRALNDLVQLTVQFRGNLKGLDRQRRRLLRHRHRAE